MKSLAPRLRWPNAGESAWGDMGLPERGVYVSASTKGDVRPKSWSASDIMSGSEPTIAEVVESDGELGIT